MAKVTFTEGKTSDSNNKTTDDLLGGMSEQFSRSIGGNLPTHFTSNLTNAYQNNNLGSLEVS